MSQPPALQTGLALRAHRSEGIVATEPPGWERPICGAAYGEPPDPPATTALLAALAEAATSATSSGATPSLRKAARPPSRATARGSEHLHDLDVLRHGDHAVEAGDVVEGEVALELELDVALQGDPAVVDADVEVVAGDQGVPDQALQRCAADLGVVAAVVVEEPDVQLVADVRDARDATGVSPAV